MRILVTGATGFIGRAFCQEALRRGHRVLALSRSLSGPGLPQVEVAHGSLDDTPWSVVSRFAPEAVLHLAWIAEPGVYLHASENETWLQQSKAWFQRLLEMGVACLAGAGTCIEYAASHQPLREAGTPLAPQFPYSKAKVALFEWLQGLPEVDHAWFRIFYPYGAGEHTNRYTSIMVRQLRAGTPLAINTPASVRDYIEVRDVAAALCHSLEARLTGAVNVGTGEGVAIGALAQRIAALVGADPALVRHGAGAAPDPTPVIVADAHRLLQTGWRPAVSLDAGLLQLIRSLPCPTGRVTD